MKVLGLCSYPIESATTRYRLYQYVEPLAEKGINLTVSSFLDSKKYELFYQQKKILSKTLGVWRPLLHRVEESLRVSDYDLVFVVREAMFFGPAIFERIFQAKCPMVLDLDDATYLSRINPMYGRLGSLFKFFGKTDILIQKAAAVTCGNRFIAEYVRGKNREAVVIPTVVDTDKFFPVAKKNEIPIIGWIGTQSTFPLLKTIFPVLQKLAEKHEFILKIVGSGREQIQIDGIKIDNADWSLERDVADFQSLDIGLYPLTATESVSNEWLVGKSGFKAIQYLAVGVPFVVSPIGVCAEIGEPGVTHFNAAGEEDWYNHLDKLLSDKALRTKMGENGRKYSLKNYTLASQADILAQTFFAARHRNAEM